MPGVIPTLKWEPIQGEGLALVVPRQYAALAGERPAGRLSQLGKLTGRKLELRVADE